MIVYVCVYETIYIYMYIFMYIVCSCIHIYICLFTYIFVYVYIQVCMYKLHTQDAHMYIHSHLWVYTLLNEVLHYIHIIKTCILSFISCVLLFILYLLYQVVLLLFIAKIYLNMHDLLSYWILKVTRYIVKDGQDVFYFKIFTNEVDLFTCLKCWIFKSFYIIWSCADFKSVKTCLVEKLD